jgi:hypothetical protein
MYMYLYCHNSSYEDVFMGEVCSLLLKTVGITKYSVILIRYENEWVIMSDLNMDFSLEFSGPVDKSTLTNAS